MASLWYDRQGEPIDAAQVERLRTDDLKYARGQETEGLQ